MTVSAILPAAAVAETVTWTSPSSGVICDPPPPNDGQCNKPQNLGFQAEKGSGFKLRYQAGMAHCSTAHLQVFVAGEFTGREISVEPGGDSGNVALNAKRSGPVTVDMRASGGCATNGIHSWGGTITVSDAPSTISGYVRDRETDKGITKTTVKIDGRRKYSPQTDDQGYYEVKVKAGDYSVRVVPPKGSWATPKKSRVSVKQNEVQAADFRIGPEPTLEAQFVDDTYSQRVALLARGWDDEGGPIGVGWGAERCSSTAECRPRTARGLESKMGYQRELTGVFRQDELPPGESAFLDVPQMTEFQVNLDPDVWPGRTRYTDPTPGCFGQFTVSQGENEKTLRVSTYNVRGVILWSDGDPDLGRGDVYCVEEDEPIVSGAAGGTASLARQTPGIIVNYDYPTSTVGFIRQHRNDKDERVYFYVGPPGENGLARLICLDYRGREDVTIVRRGFDAGSVDFGWIDNRPCSEFQGGGLVFDLDKPRP